LINNRTKLLQISHQATKESNAIYINIIKLTRLNNKEQIIKIISNLDSISNINDKYFYELKETDKATSDELNKVIFARNQYKNFKTEFITKLINSNNTYKLIALDTVLDRSFYNYQQHLENYVKANRIETTDISKDINKNSNIITTLLILIAILPVVIILLFLIIILLYYFSYWDDYVKRTME
nr:hypothetical protein [Bacteroidales bacterium]